MSARVLTATLAIAIFVIAPLAADRSLAVPGAPTIGIATAGNGQASVTFAAPANTGGEAITGYTVTASPGGLTETGTASPIVVPGLTNGTIYRFTVRATNGSGTGAASALSNPVTPAVLTVPAIDPTITWVLPSFGGIAGANVGEAASVVKQLKSRIGDGPKAQLGVSMFLTLNMNDWNVDTNNRAAIRLRLASLIGQLDLAIARAKLLEVPLGISLLTAIRERVDGVQTAAQAEDRRNVQWYQDNEIASGWVTFSQYAVKMRRIQAAYVREFGSVLAERMALNPDVLVAVTGDGEAEMSFDRFPDFDVSKIPQADRGVADYSPYAIAEFRDWVRGTGAYASGQPLAGQAYTLSARYRTDATPGTDTNGDGFTLNGDFGTSFTTWALRYYDNSWGAHEEAGALLTSAFPADAVDSGPTNFDAPRQIPASLTQVVSGGNYWNLWDLFRQQMLHRYNRDFARWITQSTDPLVGGIPFDRWYSAQIPGDMLFGNPPPDSGLRLLTGASPHWTANIAPYGGAGITGYNANLGGTSANTLGQFRRTLAGAAPLVSAFGRWAVVEWNPGDPYSTDPFIYRLENDIVRKYRPSLLMPFMIGSNHWKVLDSGFETGLKELMHGREASPGVPATPGIANPGGWLPTVTWPTPPRMLQNALLSNTHLNATANVPGTFEYSPALGTAMTTLGTHPLTVTFTPTDPDWGPVTQQVTLTVDALPIMTLSPTSTRKFAGTRLSAASVTHVTPAQQVTVSFSNPGSTGWTATANREWVILQGPSGLGNGILGIAIDPTKLPDNSNAESAEVTVTAGNVTPGSAVQTIRVEIALTSPAQDTPPLGRTDSPIQGLSGVQGAVAITGWVVDDKGVVRVDIYRNCLPIENTGVHPVPPCVDIRDDRLGRTHRVVFLGSASLIPGARPDLEIPFAHIPVNNTGWGFLALSSMLPNVVDGLPNGGQGTLSFYPYAIDTAGQRALLGNTRNENGSADTDPTKPTTITMDNLSIGKPFGAIDTPAQGGTVSGVIANFGWALTPDRNTVQGDTGPLGDIDIRQPGPSTVFVSGVPLGQVTFNHCRGNVGTPVPLSLYCNDDVSNIFGNPTPRPLYTTRTSNPTRFRNLDIGRGPIGVFVLDTRTLTNGLRTISWAVYDNEGRVEGVGSRFFTVLNSGARPAFAGSWAQVAVDAAAAAAMRESSGAVHGPATSLEGLTRGTATLHGRTGFDLRTALAAVTPDHTSTYRVRLPELGRMELALGADAERGYVVANGTLRALPVGSTFEGGVFSWAPPAGYLGTYDLVFVRGHERFDVNVTIAAPEPVLDTEAQVRMHVDVVRQVGAAVRIQGWAFDPRASIGTGIGTVHVWATRRDVAGVQTPVFVGVADLNVPRPDVATAFPGVPSASGFGLTAQLPAGTYDITAYVWNERTRRFEDARTVSAVVR